MSTNDRTNEQAETRVTYGAYEAPIGYVSQWKWVLVRTVPRDYLPLPHGPFNHTNRCNTGGCHE